MCTDLRALLSALLLLSASCAIAAAQHARASAAPVTPGRILVSGFDSNALHAYRAADGKPRGSAAPIPGAQSIVLGPDGLLYVCAEKLDQVVRVDARTLALVDVFVHDDPLTPADENGSLDGPTSATFGPGGDLFVASFETDQILRFDGASGAFLGVFVSAGSGGLDGPDAGTKFGPDGLLYVPSFWNDRVLRYDAAGAFQDEFVSFREGGLRQPRDLAFHQGQCFVASSQNNRILRYDMAGNFLGIFATPFRPYSLAFQPDDGQLYVVSLSGDNVRIFDAVSGAPRGKIVQDGAGGLAGAVYLCFVR